MNTKHTPGEWVVNYDEVCVRSDADDQSFGMLVPIAAVMDDNQEANARLIAAAPDLLAALQEAKHMFAGEYPSHPTTERIFSAIAKATGEGA